MERAGNFLGNIIRRMNRPEATLAWLESAWPSVVGERLAAHTRPLRCIGNRLELCADSTAWQAQLSGMEDELCARVNAAWGGKLVRELRFLSSGSASQPIARELDNSHTPFIRRRRT
jgi:predicted nucleic acid-binding Zn ribbon protein